MRISDWSSDVCSSDLVLAHRDRLGKAHIDLAVVAFTLGLDEVVQPRQPLGCLLPAARVGRVLGGLEIGRASCRERVCQYVSISVVAEALKQKKKKRIKYLNVHLN